MSTNTENSQIANTDLTTTENPPVVDSDSDDRILSTYSLPTLPEIIQCSEEQQSLLTRSHYAMVVFHGIADTYPTDSDIVCRYSLTDRVKAAPGDRVVLFAVGWSSIKEYIVFEWAPIPEKDERDFTVVFKAADLPKDVNEFYQVCYVSNESAVCGASVPFQVRTPNNEELTFAIDEDMVIVRSLMAVAQDKLLKAQLDQDSLNKIKLNLEKQSRSLEDKHSLTLRRLDRLQETLSTSNALNEELKKENAHLSEINEQMLPIKKQLEEVWNKLADSELGKKKIKEDLEAEIQLKNDQRDKLQTLVRELEDTLTVTTAKINTLQKEQEEVRMEVLAVNENLQKTEHERSSLAKKIFALENELTVCKFNLNNSQLENLRLKAEMEELAESNTKLNEELRNARQFEERHKNFQLEYSITDKGRLIMENTSLQKTMEVMQLRISTLEHENSTVAQVLEDTLNAEKNVCSDHCSLEKVVAQLQYRLEQAASNEKVKQEKKSSHNDQSSSSTENQSDIMAKLLDESLKENELRQQENMALRVQNEILETLISKDKSKLGEFIVVSTSDSLPLARETDAVGYRENMSTLNAEILQLRHQTKNMDHYVHVLDVKDKEIQNLESEIIALKTELLGVKDEHETELAKLTSKNDALVEQESKSQELKNEMQKITFMNEELLVQNTSLMERIHESKNNASVSMKTNVLQERSIAENLDTKLTVENEQLKRRVESISEKLDMMVSEHQEQAEKNQSLEAELHAAKRSNNIAENRCSLLLQQYDLLLERFLHSKTQLNDKCHNCAEPKLETISKNVDHLLLAMEKLASSSNAKQESQSLSDIINDLNCRLQLARENYLQLHNVMTNYRTKYNEVKEKYLKKKTGKVQLSSK